MFTIKVDVARVEFHGTGAADLERKLAHILGRLEANEAARQATAQEHTQGLQRLDAKLDALLIHSEKTMQELDDLTREVAETGTVIDSAIALLGQLAALIRANATDPTALRALATDLDAKQAALAAAITANTPSATDPGAGTGTGGGGTGDPNGGV